MLQVSGPLAPPVQGLLPRPLMLELAALVQPTELPVEGREQPSVRGHVLHAHRLPDGVHREGGHAQVHGPDAHPGGDDGADGGAAGAVVPHYKLLGVRQVQVVVTKPDGVAQLVAGN